jgi:hypothetical protein
MGVGIGVGSGVGAIVGIGVGIGVGFGFGLGFGIGLCCMLHLWCARACWRARTLAPLSPSFSRPDDLRPRAFAVSGPTMPSTFLSLWWRWNIITPSLVRGPNTPSNFQPFFQEHSDEHHMSCCPIALAATGSAGVAAAGTAAIRPTYGTRARARVR